MRARKPWVRARLIVLGWNVRFIVRYLVVDYGPEWPPFKETGNSRETAAIGQFPTSFFLEVNKIKKKKILRIFILFITIS